MANRLRGSADGAAVTGVFVCTAGASNPFIGFYRVPLIIAATILPRVYRWVSWRDSPYVVTQHGGFPSQAPGEDIKPQRLALSTTSVSVKRHCGRIPSDPLSGQSTDENTESSNSQARGALLIYNDTLR